ncbi:MAG: hypothetical protein ACT4PS_01965 [Betaproteobacteria bacterium]
MPHTLLIPHLWWSRDVAGEAYRDLAVPMLEMALTRATRRSYAAIGWEAWLCQTFEVERQRDWPIAPLTLTIDGGDPAGAYWLRADPVHLRADRDRLVLADSSAFEISRDEADTFVESLNAHFAAEKLHFSAPVPQRWYLRLDSDPQIATSPLDDAAGASIDPHLPRGARALPWHRMMNEAQMLLHGCAANEARESRGELPVNGVWLWGGGRRASVAGRHFATVTANDPLTLALGAHADIPAAPLDEDGEHWMRRLPAADSGETHLAVLEQLAPCARRGDLAAWRDALLQLERRWIAPLVAALKKGRIDALVLIVPADEACVRFELTRSAIFRFWRRHRALGFHFGAR